MSNGLEYDPKKIQNQFLKSSFLFIAVSCLDHVSNIISHYFNFQYQIYCLFQ